MAHFRRQKPRCELSGAVRITDFTGFLCEVSETVMEGDGEGGQELRAVAGERRMRAVKRANLRSGPGTDHDRLGLLEIGDEVRVTGEDGNWLRIELPQGGTAFVHGSLLAPADPDQPEADDLSRDHEACKYRILETVDTAYVEYDAAFLRVVDELRRGNNIDPDEIPGRAMIAAIDAFNDFIGRHGYDGFDYAQFGVGGVDKRKYLIERHCGQ